MVILSPPYRPLNECSILVPLLQSINRPHSVLRAIHRNYGNMVLGRCFNRRLLFVCHPDHIEEVFKLEAKGLVDRNFLHQAKLASFGNGLLNSQQETWIEQRRLLQPFFNRESVSEWEKVMIKEAKNTHDKLIADALPQINLSCTIKELIQRIFIQVLMGRSVETLANKNALLQSIDIINECLLPIIISQIISNGRWMGLMPGKRRQFQHAVKQLAAFIGDEITQKQVQHGHDLISLMIQAQDKQSGYSMSQTLLKDEAINLFIAGQETTINTLSWFFYLIGQHENVHQQLTEEIRKHRHDPLNRDNLAKLMVTKAILNETLRLYPPTPALSVQANQDIVMAGHPITRGTTIVLSMYATHRHADYWERPDEFYPAHFLDTLVEEKRPRTAFYPFGGGLHHCIGRHFAELEMMIIIVTLLRRFSFKTDAVIKEKARATLKPSRDVLVSIKPL